MQIGIIQPGRLGDIIICLPIAKFYHDKGYTVIWPIFSNYYKMIQEVIPYVKFIPITNDVYSCVLEAYDQLKSLKVNNIIDIAATFPGSICTDEYVTCGDGFGKETFDEFKYRKADVPFELKWQLDYIRDEQQEEDVYNNIVIYKEYDVVGCEYSGGKIPLKFETNTNIIEFTSKHSIFNWRKVFERANTIALVDSAMANFIEQINLNNRKILIKIGHRPSPKFINNWKSIYI